MLEEGRAALAGLVGHHLDEAQARVVVDGQVSKLPARAAGATCAVSVDAMPDALDSAEFLRVEVHELARRRALVAHDRHRLLECAEAPEPMSSEDRAYRGARQTQFSRDGPGHHALVAQG